MHQHLLQGKPWLSGRFDGCSISYGNALRGLHAEKVTDKREEVAKPRSRIAMAVRRKFLPDQNERGAE